MKDIDLARSEEEKSKNYIGEKMIIINRKNEISIKEKRNIKEKS